MEQTLDLTPFTMALREAFPEQVAFCGIQGSYGQIGRASCRERV